MILSVAEKRNNGLCRRNRLKTLAYDKSLGTKKGKKISSASNLKRSSRRPLKEEEKKRRLLHQRREDNLRRKE